MSKIKVALFGGAFDPPTLAHQLIAATVAIQLDMEVWVQPCYRHRFDKQMTHSEDRLEMCEKAFGRMRGVFGRLFLVSSYEVVNEHTEGTYKTLVAMRESFPQHEFHMLIGMDNANRIEEWRDYEKLIDEFPFIVLHRSGHAPEKDWFLREPHRVIPVPFSGSSTEVRRLLIEDPEKAKRLVNPAVFDFIEAWSVYEEKS